MAEEPQKRNKSTFYWLGGFIVVGLLAIAGFYFYLKYFAHPNSEPHANYAKQARRQNISSAIDDYTKWATALPDRRMNMDHGLTSKGLHKIASVLTLMVDSVSAGNQTRAKADVDTIRMMADSVTQNWRSGRHADMIRKAFLKTADALALRQQHRSSAVDQSVDSLVQQAQKINPETLTLNQRDEVKSAFIQTARIFGSSRYGH
ncbi:hypothetical protein [Mucilaginibacter lacusdianchii]|uniref:hypothetical protein n=1 Tax=Mucilaginibacter lacusdianchii TaxID=2684211 RepID=UPI00131A713F|nr:hypothetical protein [Mucilaginibacter sp. JXJ CY 39]